MYKDLDGKNIPLDYLRNDQGKIVTTDDCNIHLKYGEDKFLQYEVKIVGRGWSDYDDGGPAYREYLTVIVHYNDERDLVDVIKATEKLLTETSFVKNIDSIVEIKTTY